MKELKIEFRVKISLKEPHAQMALVVNSRLTISGNVRVSD